MNAFTVQGVKDTCIHNRVSHLRIYQQRLTKSDKVGHAILSYQNPDRLSQIQRNELFFSLA